MDGTRTSGGLKMMKPGFNIIEKKEYNEIFHDKISVLEFLKKSSKGEELPFNFAVLGLENLIYFAKDPKELSKYVKNILQDSANVFIKKNYVIQIVMEGQLDVVESNEKPKVLYLNKEFSLYPIFGRVKQVDVKHFLAPLNLQS